MEALSEGFEPDTNRKINSDYSVCPASRPRDSFKTQGRPLLQEKLFSCFLHEEQFPKFL